MASYWQRRKRRADERIGRYERDVGKRVKGFYEDELKRLSQEAAELYERHGGRDAVLAYRDMMQRMDEADLRLLMRDCEEFQRQHPDQAGLVAFRKDAYKLDRLEGLQQSARLHMARASASTLDALRGHFEKVAADAANAVAETMGYGSSFHTYDDDAVRQFINQPWADGKSFSERIWENTAKLASYVEREMAQAFVRGDSWQGLVDTIRKRFGQSASNALRVVQTEGTYVARQAQGAEMRREGFEEYRIDPLDDSRTCDRCRQIGRQSKSEPFRFDEAEVGVNYPPLHPRCRCFVNPAVDDWVEWARKRREERRQAGVPDETIAKRFGGVAESEGWRDDEERRRVDMKKVSGKTYRANVRRALGAKTADTAHADIVRMLRHRSGTPFEDMYAYDMATGERLGSVVNSTTPKAVNPSEELRSAIGDSVSSGGEVAILHNHPDSMPPSAADIQSLVATGARRGVIACHDGSIYVFDTVGEPAPGYNIDGRSVDRIMRLWGDDENRLLRAFEDWLGVRVEHLR